MRRQCKWARLAAVTAIGLAVLGTVSGRGAELRLRAECRPSGPLVRLGDVAQIVASDRQQADALAGVELFPTPPHGEQRSIRLREIQDLLLVRGVNLVEHRFSGSNRVTVLGVREAEQPVDRRPVSVTVAKKAERLVSEAVVRYLREHVSEEEAWSVEVALDDRQVRLATAAGGQISVRGGTRPWMGMQRFEVTAASGEDPACFVVDAQVSLPPAVVVAVRSLARGSVIGAADVQLQRGWPIEEQVDGFGSLEEVLGNETTQAIGTGRIVKRTWTRPPLVVRRRQIVTVYARGSGIRVRTTARAREDGALGDLIAVESLEDRQTYLARVSGIEEVEVYARAIHSDRAAAAARASRLARGGRVSDRERSR